MKALCNAQTKAVAANIRKAREQKSYTQMFLAAKLDISQNAYSKIELGYSNITVSRLLSVAEILEVDVMQLMKIGTAGAKV